MSECQYRNYTISPRPQQQRDKWAPGFLYHEPAEQETTISPPWTGRTFDTREEAEAESIRWAMRLIDAELGFQQNGDSR